jgi:hypothetical protein
MCMPCHYLLHISVSLCAELSLRDGLMKEAWQKIVSIPYVQIDRRVKSAILARSVLVMLRFSCASIIDAVLFSHYCTFCSSAGQCRVPTRYHQHSPALTHSLLYLALRAFLAAA